MANHHDVHAVAELKKLYEFRSQTQTKYFQDLATLDSEYWQYIETLLQQKDCIKLKLKQKYEIQLSNITNKIGLMVISTDNINAMTTNLNVKGVKSEINELDINRVGSPLSDSTASSHENDNKVSNNSDCSDKKSKTNKKDINSNNRIKNWNINVKSKSKMSKDNDNNNDNGKNTIVKSKKKAILNGKIYKTKVKSNGKIVYKCNYKHCHKKLSTICGIKVHYYGEHTSEYQCNVCQKCFGRQVDLDGHMRIHTGEKPFQCNYCDKSFNHKCNLTTHIRSHTGEKPYSCHYCDKKFRSKGEEISHTRTHTGEKPYTCNHCGKKFSQSNNLKCHQKNCRE